MKFFCTLTLFLINGMVFSQADNIPFIRLTNPYKITNEVKSSRQFIIGSTCKNCVLKINGKKVKVYPTGAFAYELNLLPGDSNFTILSEGGARSLTKKK